MVWRERIGNTPAFRTWYAGAKGRPDRPEALGREEKRRYGRGILLDRWLEPGVDGSR
jgi:hypothetical protein